MIDSNRQVPRIDDERWMRLALAEAARGRGWVEPNPMVGAVIVLGDQLVSVGHHARFGGPHAEVVALKLAGEAARGATLYVTLEPCCHQGKTPPCTDAIRNAGISRVVAAMLDPFPRVSGSGFAQLIAEGLDVQSGLLAPEAHRLNAPYLKRLATGRPHVVAKWAMTLDGKTATDSGDSRWISGPRSRSLVHERRGLVDGILVGIGTALADDPALTARPPGPRTPLRIVLDSLARLPTDSKLATTAREAPVLVVSSDQAPADRVAGLRDSGCELIAFPGDPLVPIGPLLDELGRRGLSNLLVEGGGRVLGAFLDAGEIDEVDVFLAPIIEGGTHLHSPVLGSGARSMAEALRLGTPEFEILDGDIRIRAILPRPWRGLTAS